jgi:dTDP-4-dehydrorhamnose 3,5-epimerase
MDSTMSSRWCPSTIARERAPPGFAHGFYVLSETAEVVYRCTEYYFPDDERGLRWDDPELAIDWPLLANEPILSAKDRAARSLQDAELYP